MAEIRHAAVPYMTSTAYLSPFERNFQIFKTIYIIGQGSQAIPGLEYVTVCTHSDTVTATPYTVTGFSNAALHGAMHFVHADVGQACTVSHNGAGTYKIYTASGADEYLAAGDTGGWTFMCDGTIWYALNTPSAATSPP